MLSADHTVSDSRSLSRFIPALPLLGLLLFARSVSALDLTTVIVDSISAHPEVKEKIHVYRQILQDLDIAEGGWRPSIDLQASTGSYETESPFTDNESRDYESSNLELSVTQNLFNGYDTTYQINQAEARIDSALYEVYDTADNIALRATQAFFDVVKQRRLYQLSIENVAAHKKILAKIRDRNMSGVGRRSQLQQTEGRLARAQAGQIAQQNNLEDSATQLHQILGRYVNHESLNEPVLPVKSRMNLEELTDVALSNHPAMRVASSNIDAAQSEHLRSLRSRYPNVDLRLATEYGDDIGGLDGNTEETSIVINLSYNLYNGGRDSARQQQTISGVYEQKEFAARVRRQVINTLRLSWTADDLLIRQLVFLQDHVVKSGQTVESYQEEFFIGQRDLVDLLDAENEYNSAKNQYARAKYDSLTARYRVYEGIGQLFDATGISYKLSPAGLTIGRIDTNQLDALPIPDDEDADLEVDPMDHCDNSVPASLVNPFGCLEADADRTQGISQSSDNSSPLVANDKFEMQANGILVISKAQLLANDSDADADILEIVDVSQPVVGRLAFDQGGNLVYRPLEGFTGTDSFKYTVTDNHAANVTATVEIDVQEKQNVSLSNLQPVNFDYNSTELTELSKSRVRAIIKQLKRSEAVIIEIYTYTDNIGSEAYNLALSQRRADALKTYLVVNGVESESIIAIGVGEKQPIADNSSAAGQAINRRGNFVFRSRSVIE
jgi:adhesin transport system outer membrane protein